MTRARNSALLVAAAALAVRLVHLGLAGAPAELKGDALEYHTYALNLVENGRFAGPSGERAARSPGYPLMIAAVYAVFGPNPAAVLALQCLLGTLSCLLVWFLARTLLGPPWDLAAGLLASVYHGLVGPTTLLLSECLYSFLLVLAAAALFGEKRPSALRAFAAGLAFGAVALVRAEALPIAGIFLAGSFLIVPGFDRRRAAAGVAGLALATGLWTARNAFVLGRFVPTSTRGAANMYLGLQLPLEARGLAPGPAFHPDPALDELSLDRAYADEFRELRAAVPWATALKCYAFNLLSFLYPFLPEYDFTFMLLFPFWLYAIWLSRARREWWLFAGFVAFSFTIYTFFGGPVSRYRQGMSPYLILLAVLGLKGLRSKVPLSWFARGIAAWTAAHAAIWAFAPQFHRAALLVKDEFW